MALRPSTAPTWATTTNYATSNDPAAVGQPTKEDPSSISAQGWDFVQRPRPTYFNFWQNAVGVWLDWAKDNAFAADGGTYTLDDYLALGTHGLTIWDSGELTVTDDSFFYLNGQGSFTPTSSVTVDGAWTFEDANPVFHNGATFSTAGQLSTSSDVDTFIGGLLDLAASTTTVRHRRVVGTASGTQNIAATTRYFVVPSGYSGGNGVLADGTQVGQVMTITSFEASGPLRLKRADGSTDIVDPQGAHFLVIATPLGPNDVDSVTVLWNGTFWEYSSQGRRA